MVRYLLTISLKSFSLSVLPILNFGDWNVQMARMELDFSFLQILLRFWSQRVRTGKFSVFPTVWNKIRPNFLKITANSAKIIFKFGHNSATFLANFDPIFSFYCIFMWQFFSNNQNLNWHFQIFSKKILAFIGYALPEKIQEILRKIQVLKKIWPKLQNIS